MHLPGARFHFLSKPFYTESPELRGFLYETTFAKIKKKWERQSNVPNFCDGQWNVFTGSIDDRGSHPVQYELPFSGPWAAPVVVIVSFTDMRPLGSVRACVSH